MPTFTCHCMKCGKSWQSESNTARFCPYCHSDLITGAMPGENGYNGNWNFNPPEFGNTPPRQPMTAEERDDAIMTAIIGFKWGGFIVGALLVGVWMFGLEFDFEWDSFQIAFYGLCAILLGFILRIIQKKME